jgi:hypothetical protein
MNNLYRVQLNTDAEWAQAEVSAETVGDAFAAARSLNPDDLDFQPFTGGLPINEIILTDEDGEEWRWRDEELLRRLAAEDLYIAAKNVLTALRMSYGVGWTRVARSTLGHLKEAIALAEGRKA